MSNSWDVFFTAKPGPSLGYKKGSPSDDTKLKRKETMELKKNNPELLEKKKIDKEAQKVFERQLKTDKAKIELSDAKKEEEMKINTKE
jgi:hypothetical protein